MVVHKIRDAVETTAAGAVPGSGDDQQLVGARVRELRKAKRMTLQQLAGAAGISVGYLSEIERDLARVPIGVLQTIAQLLGVHLHWFFHGGANNQVDDAEREIIVRSGQGRRLSFPGIGISDELLSPSLLGPLEVVRSTVAPGADSEEYVHDGFETGTILEGVLDLWVDGKHFKLAVGDTFAFESTRPHRCANTTKKPTVVLWIVTPPHY